MQKVSIVIIISYTVIAYLGKAGILGKAVRRDVGNLNI